jgi:hypothetical protein
MYVCSVEWEIGSEPKTDDVFPRIKVGITESKRAFIKNGKLWIDSTPLNTSVGDFANKTWTDEKAPQSKVNTFFHLEPGKCVYVTLYAVGRSHLSSTLQSTPLCVKRKFVSVVFFVMSMCLYHMLNPSLYRTDTYDFRIKTMVGSSLPPVVESC